jgi:hypothetical protein
MQGEKSTAGQLASHCMKTKKRDIAVIVVLFLAYRTQTDGWESVDLLSKIKRIIQGALLGTGKILENYHKNGSRWTGMID